MKSSKLVIPPELRKEMAADESYRYCSLFEQHGHVCEGRITWEHAIIARGKRLQLKWAIIPLCAKGHEVDRFQDAGTMIKEMNEWVALSRASEQDILDVFGEKELTFFSKSKFLLRQRLYLISKYGPYHQSIPIKYPKPLPVSQ